MQDRTRVGVALRAGAFLRTSWLATGPSAAPEAQFEPPGERNGADEAAEALARGLSAAPLSAPEAPAVVKAVEVAETAADASGGSSVANGASSAATHDGTASPDGAASPDGSAPVESRPASMPAVAEAPTGSAGAAAADPGLGTTMLAATALLPAIGTTTGASEAAGSMLDPGASAASTDLPQSSPGALSEQRRERRQRSREVTSSRGSRAGTSGGTGGGGRGPAPFFRHGLGLSGGAAAAEVDPLGHGANSDDPWPLSVGTRVSHCDFRRWTRLRRLVETAL